MKNIVLIDGNNLMFRSYYATAYSGRLMHNSKGFPTNALYGFVSMINKIVEEEKPNYITVAFDIGKNFRHEKYPEYKDGRAETPKDLITQFPIAKEILTAMGIKYLECERYEADDIIGTIVKMCAIDKDFKATIVSSDRDLLQLINFETEVKLLKQKGFIRYSEKSFTEEYKFPPIKIIDLKALAGDSSDNIPGVKGVGDKTALKLLQEYGSLDNIYLNIDKIKGALKDKLINDKNSAYFSYELATIYNEVPLNINLNDLVYNGDTDKLNSIYEELEFFSLLKKTNTESKKIKITMPKSADEIFISAPFAFYIEVDGENYHDANILGMGVSDSEHNYFINKELINDFFKKYDNEEKYTFDYKKSLYLLKKNNINIKNVKCDLMILLYLLNYNIKDDLAYAMRIDNIDVPFYEVLIKNHFENIEEEVVKKACYIFDNYAKYNALLEKEGMTSLFYDVEMPLINVLTDMEYEGVTVDKNVLLDQGETINVRIDLLKKEIFNLAGEEFNISSPKQLGEILFDKLGLPCGKRNLKGYKTDIKVLQKLSGEHAIIEKIITYRNLVKINSTYIDGLIKYISSDDKIHTIFKQNLTRTGRLSSIEPNLQNIPVKEEEGRKIRKAFIPGSDNVFLSADYSQIELRLLAHISKDEKLIEAFHNNDDIHTRVASDIYGVPVEAVSKEMRKNAKAVIFGIVYGISGFGLGENLSINAKEATIFIKKYYEMYPKVKEYMDNIVVSAKECGYVKTIYNRKRVIDELNNSNYMIRSMGERIALNTPIQGTSADIIKMAMVKIFSEFEKRNLKSKMILQVHDELIFNCYLNELDVVKEIVKEVMENIVKLDVPLKVSLDTGENWYLT